MSNRLLLINSVCGIGSTGRICADIAYKYEQDGYEVKIAYGRSAVIGEGTEGYAVRIGSETDVYAHVVYTRLTDKHGLASKRATKKFLEWAEEYDPDILWLHNIHGYYINYEMLFDWIKCRQKRQSESGKPIMEIKWTLHDCWAFTGHCSYFTYAGCNKWKSACDNCPQINCYPKSMADNSKVNFTRKKRAFSGVSNMTIVTPSNWLKNLVKDSFLSKYPIEVVYNGIDACIFKRTESNFKEKHEIKDKKLILGVANVWEKRKGLDDILKLTSMLDPDFYSVVLVGLNGKQIKNVKKLGLKHLITFPRIGTATELAKIYSAADIFVNPSYEETFGLTTAEAQACGTYTLVYKGTACEEIMDMSNGSVAQNVEEMFSIIQNKMR